MATGGREMVPVGEPVPPAPPAAGDVARHAAQVGFGALGLAREALGAMLARSGAAGAGGAARVPSPPTTADLVPGALVGLAIVAQRRAAAVAASAADGAASVVAALTRPRAVQRLLRPLEDRIWELNELARREQARNRGEAALALPVIIQQVAENVVAQLDLGRLVDRIPLEDVVEHIDVEGIVARMDLAGIVRESTASISSEAFDALREQGMQLDLFAARVVDRVLFRKRPRRLDVGAR